MNANENCYEEEINLIDLLLYCLKKWRWIVAAMLAVAVLAGGYKYYATEKSNQAALQQWNELGAEETEETEEKTSIDKSSSLQYYQSGIEQMNQAIQRQDEYIRNSVVMRLDANHLQIGTVRFILETNGVSSDNDLMDTLLVAYESYVSDGRLAEWLYAADDDIPISDLQYLLTFSDNDNSNGRTDGAETAAESIARPSGQRVFQIRIASDSKDVCETYMDVIMQGVQSYSQELQQQVGTHTLTVLASGVSERQDEAIQEYQTKILNDYRLAVQNLNALRTEAETYANNLAASDTTQVLGAPVLSSPVKSGVKYAVLGLVLGAFLAGFVLIVLFLMKDKIRSTENFENKFGMRLLGRIIEPAGNKKLFGFLDRWFQRLGEGGYADVPYAEQIKIVSKNVKTAIAPKDGLSHIMIAGTIAAQDAKAVCTAVAKEINGVVFSDYRQLIFDASALEELNDCDGVLFIEKKDVSSARLIYQESKMAVDRNVKILGAVII